jgi:hypothetical protein
MHIQDEKKFNNIEKYRKNEGVIRQPEQTLLTVTGNAWKPGQRRQILVLMKVQRLDSQSCLARPLVWDKYSLSGYNTERLTEDHCG